MTVTGMQLAGDVTSNAHTGRCRALVGAGGRMRHGDLRTALVTVVATAGGIAKGNVRNEAGERHFAASLLR